MPKYSQKKIDEAKQLRSEGKSHNEIANALSISRMCSIRWLKLGYQRRGSNIETENNEETSNTIEVHVNQSNESGNKGKEGNEGNSNKDNITFKGIKVAYDSKGSLTLVTTNNINENPPVPASDTSASKPSEDMVGYSDTNVGKSSCIEQTITKPDSIFKRSYAELLIPLGLVVCGYAMKGRLGSKTEFHEDRGDAW